MLFSTKSFSQVPCRRCLWFIHSEFTYLETDKAEDISILDIDAVGAGTVTLSFSSALIVNSGWEVQLVDSADNLCQQRYVISQRARQA